MNQRQIRSGVSAKMMEGQNHRLRLQLLGARSCVRKKKRSRDSSVTCIQETKSTSHMRQLDSELVQKEYRQSRRASPSLGSCTARVYTTRKRREKDDDERITSRTVGCKPSVMVGRTGISVYRLSIRKFA